MSVASTRPIGRREELARLEAAIARPKRGPLRRRHSSWARRASASPGWRARSAADSGTTVTVLAAGASLTAPGSPTGRSLSSSLTSGAWMYPGKVAGAGARSCLCARLPSHGRHRVGSDPPPTTSSPWGVRLALEASPPRPGRCSSASRTSTGPSSRCRPPRVPRRLFGAARSSCSRRALRAPGGNARAPPLYTALRARSDLPDRDDRARRGPGRHGHGSASTASLATAEGKCCSPSNSQR